MTVIQGALVGPDESATPLARSRVIARLHAGSYWLADHSAQVAREVDTLSDLTGDWQLDLVPHADLEDELGSWYTIWYPAIQITLTIRVPTGAGPFDVGDCLVDPGTLAPQEGVQPPFYVPMSTRGQPAGVATLDAAGLLAAGQRASDRAVIQLADQPTIATNALAGDVFSVTLEGDRVLGPPTNAADGMRRLWRFRQDATGGRTITLPTDPGGFRLASGLAGVDLDPAPARIAYLGAIYDALDQHWHVLAFEPGI